MLFEELPKKLTKNICYLPTGQIYKMGTQVTPTNYYPNDEQRQYYLPDGHKVDLFASDVEEIDWNCVRRHGWTEINEVK